MSKYTPGHWNVIGTAPLIAANVGEKNAAVIAEIVLPGSGWLAIKDYEERNANAYLMAAAPELLETLALMLDAAETDCLDVTSIAWRNAMIAAREVIKISKG